MNTNNEATLKKKKPKKPLSKKVATVAGNAVSQQGYVSAIDLFLGLNWLTQAHLLDWKKGKIQGHEQYWQY